MDSLFGISGILPYDRGLMTLSIKRLPIIIAGFLLLVSVAGVSGCRKKPGTEITKAPEVRLEQKQTVDLLQKAGLKLYPKGEILDTMRKDQAAPNAPEEKPETISEVTVARAWLAVPDSVEKVQEYYSASHPYVLTREHRSDGTLFIQLASVEKISDAIARGVSPITLVDIRRKPLTAADLVGSVPKMFYNGN